jgi:hypothetical protein
VLHLLQREHPRRSGRNPAGSRYQADHARVILGAVEIRADLIVGAAGERALANSSLKSALSVVTSGSICGSGTRRQRHVAGAAAEMTGRSPAGRRSR